MQKLPLFALCLGLTTCTEYYIDSNFFFSLFIMCFLCILFYVVGSIKVDNVDSR